MSQCSPQVGGMALDNVRTVYCDLPNTVGGFTVATPDDFFTIVLNQNLSYDRNVQTYKHELEHIKNGDFDKTCSADIIEISAHIDCRIYYTCGKIFLLQMKEGVIYGTIFALVKNRTI